MKPLLALKLKNELLTINAELNVQLKNVAVNGVKMGCSGFITDPKSGRIVYVNTDNNHGTNGNRAYYRTARHAADYTGGHNQFQTYDQLAQSVASLLASDNFEHRLAA